IKSFIHVLQIYRIDRLHADKDPFTSGGSDQINQFFVAQRFALICATQKTWAFAAMMSRSSDLVRLTLMAKLSSMKKTAIWPPSLRARAFSSSNSLTTLAFVRNRMESPKNPVTVQNSQPQGQPRPDSTGTMRNVPQPSRNFLSKGCITLGMRLNWLRSRLSHGIAG